jgi:hypothetical protein
MVDPMFTLPTIDKFDLTKIEPAIDVLLPSLANDLTLMHEEKLP